MRASFIYTGCIFLILFTSCPFDEDGIFIPKTEAGFFLVLDSLTGEKQILKIEDEVIFSHWEENWDILSQSLGDISGDETQLWVSQTSPPSLVQLDLPDNQIIEKVTDLPLVPDFICLGKHHILISDSTNHLIGFYHIKSKTIDTIQGFISPGLAMYRSGKFYLGSKSGKLRIFLDQTASILNEINLGNPIYDFQSNARTSVFAYSYAGNLFYETEIDYHSDHVLNDSKVVAYSKSRLSPYLDRPLGSELLANIRLFDDILVMGDKPACDDFEVDFLESVAYYQYQDSFYLLNAPKSRILPLGPFDGKFLKAYFLRQ
ncbi:MAG: hypothetical protein KDD63_01050 [Bacteroidetes bacterium]|nr:hypothetical protein [Bacteroidota bacterium]